MQDTIAFEIGSLVGTTHFLHGNPGPDDVVKDVMRKGTVGIVTGLRGDMVTVDFGAVWGKKQIEMRHLEVLGHVASPIDELAIEDDLVTLVAVLSAENAALRNQLAYHAGGLAS